MTMTTNSHIYFFLCAVDWLGVSVQIAVVYTFVFAVMIRFALLHYNYIYNNRAWVSIDLKIHKSSMCWRVGNDFYVNSRHLHAKWFVQCTNIDRIAKCNNATTTAEHITIIRHIASTSLALPMGNANELYTTL